MHDLHSILLKTPDVVSTRFDNESGINLKLSISLSSIVIEAIGTVLFIYFFMKDIFSVKNTSKSI